MTILSFLTWLSYQPSLARTTLSRTNFHSPKGVRAVATNRYSVYTVPILLMIVSNRQNILPYIADIDDQSLHRQS